MRFTEKLLPENVKVSIKHFHQGNADDPDAPPIGPRVPYATRCQIRDRQSGAVLAEDWALCSRRDVPNRKVGRAVATGRAIKQFVLSNNPYLVTDVWVA